MKTQSWNRYLIAVILMISVVLAWSCKEDDEAFPETRLFRPVLNDDLKSEGNSIIVNMAKMKKAVSYTIELSRDEFATIDYTIESDTNYVLINTQLLNGDPLFWNTLYQVRAIAHAEEPEFDSKISDLGAVRTQRFPTILNVPATYDVTDVAARVTWTVSGAPVTEIKLFSGSDLKLTTPLETFGVSDEDQTDGETFVTGLSPSTDYQIAIFSGETLRGWVNYSTLIADIDPGATGVVDIRADESPDAVINAVAAAADGAIILVKRGITYNLPTVALNKSITIQAAHGFGKQKAKLFTTTNWNIAGASNIDHIRFIDLEIRGEDPGGDYVFNPAVNDIYVGELLFQDCEIGTLRGIIRIRNSNVLIDNYKIVNCVVDNLGGYGILTTDTAPNAVTPTARVNNIVIQRSTVNKTLMGISSYNNVQSILIEDCTFSNYVQGGSGNYMFRFRGGADNNNVINGITIKNTIFGPGWDQSANGTYAIRGKEGLPTTSIETVNIHTTSEFAFQATYEISSFPLAPTYAKKQTDLWVNPLANDFTFKDNGFAGRFDSGDPRWRVQL
jgi:hypothetical protein